MKIRLALILGLLSTSLSAQGIDIFSQAPDASSAGLAVIQNPLYIPHNLNQTTAPSASFTAWSWVADIGGANLSVQNGSWIFGLQSSVVDNIEVRGDEPSLDPLSTYQYSVLAFGLGYGFEIKDFNAGLSVNVVREQGLNEKVWGMAVNASSGFALSENGAVAYGLRNLGRMGTLESQRSDLPNELWLSYVHKTDTFSWLAEINTGNRPLAAGLQYTPVSRLRINTGVQLESTRDELRLHPAAGIEFDWDNFSLALALSQITHPVAQRNFLTFIWNY